MSFADRIYWRAPVAAQRALVALWGWYWYRRRFGGEFPAYVREIAARERWTAAEFVAEADARLAVVLQAASRSPYYSAIFAERGLRISGAPRDALARLPLLSKETLRTRARDLLTETRLPRTVEVFRSSGTTGTPTEIFFERTFHRRVQAFFEVRIRHWAGVHHRSRRAMFGVRKVCRASETQPPFWRSSPAENLTYFSIYHLSDDLMPYYIEQLNKLRPAIIMGYPNSLGTLARFSLRSGRPLAPATAVVTTSETVTADTRHALETAWGCRVYDNYCAVESCVLATQCEHGRYHVNSDFGIVEILRADGTPCGPGEPGEVICTGLHNTLQPLLRYRIGDVAAWASDQQCPCGRALPIIEGIDGRVEDMCYTPQGRAVLRFDTVFKGVYGIKEAQIAQVALDHFVIRVVPDAGFDNANRQRLKANMALHVGEVRTDVETMSTIARTASGKFKAVSCEMVTK